ncbi:MAG: HAD-IIIC family phosphatase [Alphaproteobacteria bacterium]
MESPDISAELRHIKRRIAENEHEDAFRGLMAIASDGLDYPTQARLARLLRTIPKTNLGLRPLRVALLAGCTLDHFAEVLVLWAAQKGLDAAVWLAPYGTIEQTILDGNSGLYAFAPDVVWIFTTHRDVTLDVAPGAASDVVSAAIASEIERVADLWRVLQETHSCQILHNTPDIPAIDVFGNYEANVPWSRRSLLRAFTLALAAARPPGVLLFDLDHIAACHGKRRWVDARFWYHSKHPFAFEAIGLVAHAGAATLAALRGLSRKCLVTDLDNTLWGGIIGDDGVEGIRLGAGAEGEAFVDLQAHLKALKERGIILAVCSRNEEATARTPFETHPDMRLALEDIAVFRANWENKAANIKAIAQTLGIGLESLVFLDDTSAERDSVRHFLPMVAVPELPNDPALFLQTLAAHGYFETTSFGAEDAARSTFYRDNARREESRITFSDITAYLQSLRMEAAVGTFDALHLSRVAQLINRSNQFHLTGTRYGEEEIRALADDEDHVCRWYSLTDRFGDNGLISAVILKRRADDGTPLTQPSPPEKGGRGLYGSVLEIDTWVMSCRVLSRGMEEFILNDIVAIARSIGAGTVVGRHVPSRRNGLVSDLYRRLGFAPMDVADDGTTTWRLATTDFTPLPTTIRPAT